MRLCAVTAVVGAIGAVLAGCQPSGPAAATNEELEGDVPGASGTLSTEERQQILAAMGSVIPKDAEGLPRASASPWPRGRWSDVLDAANETMDRVDILATIFRAEQVREDRWEFAFALVDDRRGMLVVERRPSPEVYVARARVGRLNLDEALVDRILDAFEEEMARFGQKRSFANDE